MTSANLRAALNSPPLNWNGRKGSGDLETLIREGQNRFKRPHLRDYGYRLPVPFRWGPNGSLLLLLALIGAFTLIAAVF